jgi:hypothetical protein
LIVEKFSKIFFCRAKLFLLSVVCMY